jgi:hypothetical protein
MRKTALRSKLFALADPVPLTVAILMTTSLIEATATSYLPAPPAAGCFSSAAASSKA